MTVTIGDDFGGSIVILPSFIANKTDLLTIFSLPHPSNNRSKKRINLIGSTEGEIFQLKTHEFSKGCAYNTQSDLANEKYHYTTNEEPLKSTFLINEANRSDGHVMESGTFQIAAKYDIAFNLIGFYYKDSASEAEKEYEVELEVQSSPSEDQANCFTARDFHDQLIDCHDTQWSKICVKTLEAALMKIAEPIEEAGCIYFKLTQDRVTKYLAGKVSKMASNLPKSLPIAKDLPADIQKCARVVIATNLLVSLIPRLAYLKLKEFTPVPNENLDDIKEAFHKYEKYKSSLKCSIAEKELLVNAAMTVGLPTGKVKVSAMKKVTKKTIKVRKQTGAIDGFFKQAN